MVKKENQPFCSIIVLNYFGEKVITSTIESLLQLNYPRDRFEIIIVDNNSQDKSREIITKIAEKNTNVKLIFNSKNLGFSKGNNVGIRAAKGEWVCLLNNDCIVDENWLKELLKISTSNKKIFAANSKILLYPKYINLKLNVSSSVIPLYAWLTESELCKLYKEGKGISLKIWRNKDNNVVEIPFDPQNDNVVQLSILFNLKEKNRNGQAQGLVELSNPAIKVHNISKVRGNIEYKIRIDTRSRYLQNSILDKIQNAGIMVFQDGYGRDIGSIVRYSQQYYEFDRRQYNQDREVYAACGAAVMYRKSVLNKVGLLDESFFMYYEDVELAERARFFGYKSMYAPKAVARHIHALSSGEWSPFFIYHAEKGRLLHVFYNFPITVFLKIYMEFLAVITMRTLGLMLNSKKLINLLFKNKFIKENDPSFSKLGKNLQYCKVLFYFIYSLPYLLVMRYCKHLGHSSSRINANYQEILAGKWYRS